MDIGTANGGYICQDVDFELSLKVWEDKVSFKNKGTCKTCWATGEKIYVFRIRASRNLFFLIATKHVLVNSINSHF